VEAVLCPSGRPRLCRQKEEPGLEQLELEEIKSELPTACRLADPAFRELASEAGVGEAAGSIRPGPLPILEPRALEQGLGCVFLPVAPSVSIRGKNGRAWRRRAWWRQRACCSHCC
jgi:hypothetical protein